MLAGYYNKLLLLQASNRPLGLKTAFFAKSHHRASITLLLDQFFLFFEVVLILVNSLRRYTNPTSPTHLDPLDIPQRLLSNVLLDLPGRKSMSLREDFFHLESIISSNQVIHVISVACLFECSSRRLWKHEEDVDKGRSVERREDKVLRVHPSAQHNAPGRRIALTVLYEMFESAGGTAYARNALQYRLNHLEKQSTTKNTIERPVCSSRE